MTEERNVNIPTSIQIRSPERLEELYSKFLDIVTALNDLESMSIGKETMTKSRVGYNTGRAFAAFKDIMKTFVIKF